MTNDTALNMDEVIEAAPQNQLIQNTLQKMDLKLKYYRNPVCSVSGGSDSDIMIDIIERVRFGRPVTYVFFDTGIEYEATKRHLKELEAKYVIKIERRNAVVPVPRGCKTCGVPFLTKLVSDYIGRLQSKGFQWEDEPLEALENKYKKCRTELRWWCNDCGEKSDFNIDRFQYLKAFMIANPPRFSISDGCCDGAKKKTAHLRNTDFNAGIEIIGLRQAEGGRRALSIHSCFSAGDKGEIATYRPLWFWTNADKQEYKDYYGVDYSDCYEVWGFKRTGCAGCPFNSRFEDDLKAVEQYEPKLYKACNNIFGQSYEYTRAYRRFKAVMQEKAATGCVDQISFDDLEADGDD